MIVAFGFTSAWAAAATGTFPDVPWSQQYGNDLREALEGAHAAGVQVMNTGICAQSFSSVLGLSATAVGQPISRIMNIMKALVDRVAALAPHDLHERGAAWAITKILAGPAYPRHGYTTCHGIQLAEAMGLLDTKGEDWVPEGYGRNTCEAIAELTGEDVGPLMSSPALVCMRLTMLRRAVAEQRGLRSIAACANNDIKIQLCQWVKDDHGREVATTGVFTKALTSMSAAPCANAFLTKRKLGELVHLAVKEAAANKRRRKRH